MGTIRERNGQTRSFPDPKVCRLCTRRSASGETARGSKNKDEMGAHHAKRAGDFEQAAVRLTEGIRTASTAAT